MSKWLVASLKASAEQIEIIDTGGQAFKDLCAFLDSCSLQDLEKIVAADLKWFSSMAKNRIKALA